MTSITLSTGATPKLRFGIAGRLSRATPTRKRLGDLYFDGRGVPQDYAQAACGIETRPSRVTLTPNDDSGVSRWWPGVPQDYAEAYFWHALAAAGERDASDAKEAAKDRDEAASHLTPADLSREQERARKWFEAHPGEATMTRYV